MFRFVSFRSVLSCLVSSRLGWSSRNTILGNNTIVVVIAIMVVIVVLVHPVHSSSSSSWFQSLVPVITVACYRIHIVYVCYHRVSFEKAGVYCNNSWMWVVGIVINEWVPIHSALRHFLDSPMTQ